MVDLVVMSVRWQLYEDGTGIVVVCNIQCFLRYRHFYSFTLGHLSAGKK